MSNDAYNHNNKGVTSSYRWDIGVVYLIGPITCIKQYTRRKRLSFIIPITNCLTDTLFS